MMNLKGCLKPQSEYSAGLPPIHGIRNLCIYLVHPGFFLLICQKKPFASKQNYYGATYNPKNRPHNYYATGIFFGCLLLRQISSKKTDNQLIKAKKA